MSTKTACICGHSEEEHGHDPDFPGSTSCRYNNARTASVESQEQCDCIAFEADTEETSR